MVSNLVFQLSNKRTSVLTTKTHKKGRQNAEEWPEPGNHKPRIAWTAGCCRYMGRPFIPWGFKGGGVLPDQHLYLKTVRQYGSVVVQHDRVCSVFF